MDGSKVRLFQICPEPGVSRSSDFPGTISALVLNVQHPEKTLGPGQVRVVGPPATHHFHYFYTVLKPHCPILPTRSCKAISLSRPFQHTVLSSENTHSCLWQLLFPGLFLMSHHTVLTIQQKGRVRHMLQSSMMALSFTALPKLLGITLLSHLSSIFPHKNVSLRSFGIIPVLFMSE